MKRNVSYQSNKGRTAAFVAAVALATIGIALYMITGGNLLKITDFIRPNAEVESAPPIASGQTDKKQYQEKDNISSDNPASSPQPSSVHNSQLDEYRRYALEKINEDRQKFGKQPVYLSTNVAAQVHAEELVQTRHLSHWTTDGMKPYMRYSVNGGIGYVAQNAAAQYTQIDDPVFKSRIDACKRGLAYCDPVDIKKAIDTAEYNMMYNDAESEWGHKDNILDKYHTHVSIGIAYDSVDFAMVQNFENQYIMWDKQIGYEKSTGIVTMKGKIEGDIELQTINIYYDPLPKSQTYGDNYNKTSYGGGTLEALVVKPAPFGYTYPETQGYMIMVANKWDITNNGTAEQFAIEFSLNRLSSQYGDGAYTVILWGKDKSEGNIPLTNIALFKN